MYEVQVSLPQPQSSCVIVLHVYIVAQEYYISAAIVTFMLKCIVDIKCKLFYFISSYNQCFVHQERESVCVFSGVWLYII